jgi:hypothetical protein
MRLIGSSNPIQFNKGMDWTGLDGVDWIAGIGIGWVGLVLDWYGIGLVLDGWIGLDWVGRNWIGWDEGVRGWGTPDPPIE